LFKQKGQHAKGLCEMVNTERAKFPVIRVIKELGELTVTKPVFFLILTKTRDCDEVNKY